MSKSSGSSSSSSSSNKRRHENKKRVNYRASEVIDLVDEHKSSSTLAMQPPEQASKPGLIPLKRSSSDPSRSDSQSKRSRDSGSRRPSSPPRRRSSRATGAAPRGEALRHVIAVSDENARGSDMSESRFKGRKIARDKVAELLANRR
mmetsp:Transcript_16813/g.31576  ORF Transcript_16813/g.31576 Transcript_16813/m.31576 type:complete len:147 (+) Transcript_16813:2382-2822(+)